MQKNNGSLSSPYFLITQCLKCLSQYKVFSCGFRTSFLWLFILAWQLSVLPTYCFEHTGHVSRYSMNLLLQWNLLFSLNKVAPVGD